MSRAERPTRVLHLLDVLRPSGAETTLAVAGPRWADHAVDADVLATGEELGSYAPTLRAAGYRTGHLPLDPFGRFAPRFRRLLLREGYDVVHNHVERANLYVALLARSAGVRVVHTLHGIFDFEGALRLERRVQRTAMRAIGTRFVAVSSAVADNERQRYANPTTVIGNWYDDSRHRPRTAASRAAARQALGIAGDRRVVVTVGNCSTIKNHDSLLQAIARAGLRDITYLHAGTGDTEAQERRLAHDLGIDGQVRFLGFTDAAPLLQAADLFVMPSRHEGQGIAAIEALAVGVPTLLADSPGLRTLAELGTHARFVPPTPGDLAAGILASLRQPPSDGQVTAAAGAVAARFGVDESLAALAAVYRGEDPPA